MTDTAIAPRRRTVSIAMLACVLAVVELQLLSLLYDYQTGLKPACRAALGDGPCALIGYAVPRVLSCLAALVLFAIARPAELSRLVSGRAPAATGLGLNLAGFAVLALPSLALPQATLAAAFGALALVWAAGAALAGAGLLVMIAGWPAWRTLFRRNWPVLAPLIAVGLIAPELAKLIQPVWRSEALTDVTFRAVVAVLEFAGYAIEADPGTKTIGAQDFAVRVATACSGVEGFALITLFLTVYLALFRRDIAFPAALLLYPVGIVASWVFNVLRIAILLVIGIEGSPELAVGGFHSRAGWLGFIILAFALIAVARNVPAFRRETAAAPTEAAAPFFRDPVAAALAPFAVFMLSAHVVATVSETPGALYPWRALAMGAALALFWPVWRALPWRPDPLAAGAGIAIGLLWAATAESGPAPYGALAGAALFVWTAARIVGTGFFVPLIEEAFFRGYLLDRLAGGAVQARSWRVAAAVVVSAGLFAALHDRWLAAFLSGLVFGALVVRSGRMVDAVVSHMAANLTIAAWALATDDWSIL